MMLLKASTVAILSQLQVVQVQVVAIMYHGQLRHNLWRVEAVCMRRREATNHNRKPNLLLQLLRIPERTAIVSVQVAIIASVAALPVASAAALGVHHRPCEGKKLFAPLKKRPTIAPGSSTRHRSENKMV
jgi:hypothetical protein